MWEEMSPEEREKVKEVHRQGLRQSQLSASSSTPGAAEKGKGKEDWENVSVSASTSTQVGTTEGESPSVADARDLVTGESQGSAKVAEVIVSSHPLYTPTGTHPLCFLHAYCRRVCHSLPCQALLRRFLLFMIAIAVAAKSGKTFQYLRP